MEHPTGTFPANQASTLPLQRDAFMGRLGPHLPLLRRFAARLARSAEDGEDLFQDVMVKLYEQRERLDAIQLLQPWLMRVMYHHFVDQCRRFSPLTGATSIHEMAELADGGQADDPFAAEASEVPEHQVQRMQVADAVRRAIGRLPGQQRTLVHLHEIEGLSLPEVARRLGLSVNTVKSGLSRARCSLRISLHANGGAAASTQRRRATALRAAAS